MYHLVVVPRFKHHQVKKEETFIANYSFQNINRTDKRSWHVCGKRPEDFVSPKITWRMSAYIKLYSWQPNMPTCSNKPNKDWTGVPPLWRTHCPSWLSRYVAAHQQRPHRSGRSRATAPKEYYFRHYQEVRAHLVLWGKGDRLQELMLREGEEDEEDPDREHDHEQEYKPEVEREGEEVDADLDGWLAELGRASPS